MRRFSGLFFGLYVVAHMAHQCAAALGPARYDAFGSLMQSLTIENPLLEVVFVWAPLAVHLTSDVAFRWCGGKKGGGLRRRFSFVSGYVLLGLVAAHVGFTRFGGEAGPYEFAGLAKRLGTAGLLPLLFLIALAGTASVHLAAGSINAAHQVKALDRAWRDRLDWLIGAIAALLFAGVCVGLIVLRMRSG